MFLCDWVFVRISLYHDLCKCLGNFDIHQSWKKNISELIFPAPKLFVLCKSAVYGLDESRQADQMIVEKKISIAGLKKSKHILRPNCLYNAIFSSK